MVGSERAQSRFSFCPQREPTCYDGPAAMLTSNCRQWAMHGSSDGFCLGGTITHITVKGYLPKNSGFSDALQRLSKAAASAS